MYRYPQGSGEKDTIHTAFNNLFFPASSTVTTSARMNMNMTFWGQVHLLSGVTYYYGYDAQNQGLGSVAPNPVRGTAKVPFSVIESGKVSLDLFDMNGQKVQTLVDESLVRGKYSYDIKAENLVNGVYIVRMVAGAKVYTTKINVSK
jgi:hypothetical protein